MPRSIRENLRRRDRTCRSFRQALVVAGVLTAMPVVGAEGPAGLRWWSNGQFAETSARDVTAASHSAKVVEPPSPLEWWEAKRTADSLGWWLVPRPALDSGWGTPGRETLAQQGALAPPARQQDDGALRPRSPESDEPIPAPSQQDDVPYTDPDVVGDPFAKLPVERLRPLSEIRVALDTPTGGLAEDNRSADFFAAHGTVALAPHHWSNQTPEAAAYCFYSRPLWYEDANLERCGYTHGCCQTVVSGAYFFGNTALLPYRMAAEPQCTTVAAKPFCPPGCKYSCAQNYLPPPSAAGVAAEAAAVTGLFFLIP